MLTTRANASSSLMNAHTPQENRCCEKASIDVFPWDAHFETGIELIDEQHQKLVEILNALARHVACGTVDLSLSEASQALIDYSAYHFETEEKIWAQYLPDHALNDKHHEAHETFLNRIREICTTAHDEEDCCSRLLEFLTHWLAYHILDRDRRAAIMLIDLRDHGMSLEAARQHANQVMTGVIQHPSCACTHGYPRPPSIFCENKPCAARPKPNCNDSMTSGFWTLWNNKQPVIVPTCTSSPFTTD